MASQPDLPEQLTGVGATALGVALLRAQESRRADRLFDDPYAQHFLDAVDPAASPWAAASASTEQGFLHLVAEQVAVRTRFLDQTLLEAAQAGCGQVVVLACGVDTRSYRLDWPAGTQIFDVDFADVLAFRNAVLAQRGAAVPGNRISVATDLREDWPHAVTEAGLDPRQPTAWLAEGLLYALPPRPRISSSTASPPPPHPAASWLWTTPRTPSCSARPAGSSPPSSSTCGRADPPTTSPPGSPGTDGVPPSGTSPRSRPVTSAPHQQRSTRNATAPAAAGWPPPTSHNSSSVPPLKSVVDIGRGSGGSPRRSCARRTGGSGCSTTRSRRVRPSPARPRFCARRGG